MRRALIGLLLLAGTVPFLPAQPVAEQPGAAKLLIAFASTRERRAPPYPMVYFYEHDGVASGKLLGSIPSITKGENSVRSDSHPSLSADGRYCAFAAQLGIQDGGRIEVWDRQEKKLLASPPGLNDLPSAHQIGPSLAGNGAQVAFTAWGRGGRWDVFLYDLSGRKFLDLPGLNTPKYDERMPALNGDGRFLAYASNAPGGAGGTDVSLYDLREKKIVPLPGLNSKHLDMEPSLSADGRLIAFTSERPEGSGGRDIYLYDRSEGKLLPLPGLNSAAHEHSPSLSPDGRYLVFVSERLGGAGERDIYLYDRQAQKLLPTPGLNSKEDDFDPCVIVLPP